jgi:hypothetical protein
VTRLLTRALERLAQNATAARRSTPLAGSAPLRPTRTAKPPLVRAMLRRSAAAPSTCGSSNRARSQLRHRPPHRRQPHPARQPPYRRAGSQRAVRRSGPCVQSAISTSAPRPIADECWCSHFCSGVNDGSARLLTGLAPSLGSGNTPAACIAACAAKGFTYAGVEYGIGSCLLSFSPVANDREQIWPAD